MVCRWNLWTYWRYRGLANGRMQTYEQNTELGMICGKLDRQYYSASAISSIVIPPK